MYRLSLAFLSVIVLLSHATVIAQDATCIDLAETYTFLGEAQAAAASGNIEDALTNISQARAELESVEAACSTAVDDATVEPTIATIVGRGDSIGLNEEPDFESPVIITLDVGDNVDVLCRTQIDDIEWFQVMLDDIVAWIDDPYIDIQGDISLIPLLENDCESEAQLTTDCALVINQCATITQVILNGVEIDLNASSVPIPSGPLHFDSVEFEMNATNFSIIEDVHGDPSYAYAIVLPFDADNTPIDESTHGTPDGGALEHLAIGTHQLSLAAGQDWTSTFSGQRVSVIIFHDSNNDEREIAIGRLELFFD